MQLGLISVYVADADRAKRFDDDPRAGQMFAKLADGGIVLMPFEETFFARRFGMTNDQFGVRRIVSVAPVALART